jgi:hypothetical protein
MMGSLETHWLQVGLLSLGDVNVNVETVIAKRLEVQIMSLDKIHVT